MGGSVELIGKEYKIFHMLSDVGSKKESECLKVVDFLVAALLIVGALNWGLIGFFGFNLVGTIFGDMTTVSRVIYALVALSGFYEAFNFAIGLHH